MDRLRGSSPPRPTATRNRSQRPLPRCVGLLCEIGGGLGLGGSRFGGHASRLGNARGQAVEFVQHGLRQLRFRRERLAADEEAVLPRLSTSSCSATASAPASTQSHERCSRSSRARRSIAASRGCSRDAPPPSPPPSLIGS